IELQRVPETGSRTNGGERRRSSSGPTPVSGRSASCAGVSSASATSSGETSALRASAGRPFFIQPTNAWLAKLLFGQGASNGPLETACNPGATGCREKRGWLPAYSSDCPSHNTRLKGPCSPSTGATASRNASTSPAPDTKSRTSAPRERGWPAPNGCTRTLVTAARRPRRDTINHPPPCTRSRPPYTSGRSGSTPAAAVGRACSSSRLAISTSGQAGCCCRPRATRHMRLLSRRQRIGCQAERQCRGGRGHYRHRPCDRELLAQRHHAGLQGLDVLLRVRCEGFQ